MISYARQSILDQESLALAKVAIIGITPITNYFTACAAGLGLTNLLIVDNGCEPNANEFMSANLSKNRLAGLEEQLKKINPLMNITPVQQMDLAFLGKPDILLDFTNEKESKDFSSYAAAILKPRLYISACSTENNFNLLIKRPDSKLNCLFAKDSSVDQQSYFRQQQGSYASCMAAAIALDEARKIASPEKDEYPCRGISYSLKTEKRFSSSCISNAKEDLRSIKAMVAGAGGIGTYLALNLALMGIGELHIFDGDVIEDHNLNRQVLYSEDIGRSKANVIAKKLRKISALTKVVAHNKFIRSRKDLGKYDAIFSCLDNWEYRFMLSRFASAHDIPFINGSVTAFGAKAEYTQCMDCKYDNLKDVGNTARGCLNVANTNIVTNNALIGGFMAAELKPIAFPGLYPSFKAREFKYASKNHDSARFRVVPETRINICGVHQ